MVKKTYVYEKTDIKVWLFILEASLHSILLFYKYGGIYMYVVMFDKICSLKDANGIFNHCYLEHKIQRFLNFNAQLHRSLIKQSLLVILIPQSNSPIAWWLILLHSIQFNLVRCLIVAEIWFWESPSFKILGMYEYCIFLAVFFANGSSFNDCIGLLLELSCVVVVVVVPCY